MGSSRTRARTHVPCIGRWILNHCATREVPSRTISEFTSEVCGGAETLGGGRVTRRFPTGAVGSSDKNNNKPCSCYHVLSIDSALGSEVTSLNPHSPEGPGLQSLFCSWEKLEVTLPQSPSWKMAEPGVTPRRPDPHAWASAHAARRSRAWER